MSDSSQGKRRKAVYRDPGLQIIFAVTLMAVLGVSSITPAFPNIVQALGISPQAVGSLITAFTLPGVLLAPVLGVLADQVGRKKILVPSLMLFAIAGGACFFAREFKLLLALRFLQGMGAASLGSLNITLISDLYVARERTTAMGYNASVLSVGTASYPAIGGALATLGWYYPFILPVVAVPVGLLVLLGLKNPEPRNDQDFKEYLAHTWQSVKSREIVGLFMASVLTFIIFYGSYLTYFPLFAEASFAASPLVIGLVMSSSSLMAALVASQLARMAKLYSEGTLIKASCVLYMLAMALMPRMPRLWLLTVPILILGAAQGINVPSVQTLLAGLAPVQQRAALMSINGMVLRLGQTLGPLVMGAVYMTGGLGGTFYAGAAFAVAMLILVAILIK
jgi:ACDE family multidrug resistance protein